MFKSISRLALNIVDNKVTPIVFLILISISSYGYYLHADMVLFYNDTTSHLNISRRVVDNIYPSLAQIGSTWLPLLHFLELPLIWYTPFWQSGFAGSVVSMSSFVLLGLFVYGTIMMLTDSRIVAFFGVLLLSINANLLFLQAAPMFEPLCLATAMGSTYFLLRWNKTGNITAIVWSAFLMMLSTMTRYDGWVYGAFQTVVLAFVAYRKYGRTKTESAVMLFCTLAFLGVVAWLLYNWLIFGSPTYFSHNDYSAFHQQLEYESRGLLPTKGNLLLAAGTYSMASFYNLGWILAPLVIIGIIYVFIYHKSFSFHDLLIVGVPLISPLLFNTYALFKGHTIIVLPELPPYGIFAAGLINKPVPFFNIRYGLMTLPAYALLIAIVFWKSGKLIKTMIILLVCIQLVAFYSDPFFKIPSLNFVTAKDIVGSRKHLPEREKGIEWFRQHYDGGLVLASSSSMDIELFENGIDLKNYITEGTRNYWSESLKDPSKYANWIILQKDHTDRLGKAMLKAKQLEKFELVHQTDSFEVYKLKKNY